MKRLNIAVVETGAHPVDRDKLLAHAYAKLADSNGMIPGQTEKYDSDLIVDKKKAALRSLRINDAHRLFYIVYDLYFIPLEVVWNHEIDKSIFGNPDNKEVRAQAAVAIQAAIAADQQASAAQTVSAQPVGAAAASSSPKKNHIVLTEEQALIARPEHRAQVLLAPAGSGKTEIAKIKMRQWHQAEQGVLYFTVSSGLADKVRSELSETACWSLATIEQYIATNFPPLTEARKPADFAYFCKWYQDNILSLDRYRKKESADLHALYSEFTQVILQPGRTINSFLSEAEYEALSARESYIASDKRMVVYRQFHQYFSGLLTSKSHYEPRARWHAVFFELQRLKNSDEQFPFILFDALAIDEVQQIHPWLLAILLCLVKNPRSGQIFLCGDPHQNAGMQRPLVLQPIQKLFSILTIPDFTVNTVSKNFRNAQNIGKLAHLLLLIEQRLWGSSERGAAFGIDTSATVVGGDIITAAYTAEFAAQVTESAKHIVIIPDQTNLIAVQAKFGDHMVVPALECGGLEWEHVIFYGFDSMSDQLTALNRLITEDMLRFGEIAYSRKKGEVLPSLALRVMLQTLMTAVTRAKKSVTMLVDENTAVPALISRMISVVLPVAAAADSVPLPIEISSPLTWIQTAVRYLEDNKEVLAHKTFYRVGVWGTASHAKEAEIVFAQNDFKELLAALGEKLQNHANADAQIEFLQAFLLSKKCELERPSEAAASPASPKKRKEMVAEPVVQAAPLEAAGVVVPIVVDDVEEIYHSILNELNAIVAGPLQAAPDLKRYFERLPDSPRKAAVIALHAIAHKGCDYKRRSDQNNKDQNYFLSLCSFLDQIRPFTPEHRNALILTHFTGYGHLISSVLSGISVWQRCAEKELNSGNDTKLIFQLMQHLKTLLSPSLLDPKNKKIFLQSFSSLAGVVLLRGLLNSPDFERIFLNDRFLADSDFRAWFVSCLKTEISAQKGGVFNFTGVAPSPADFGRPIKTLLKRILNYNNSELQDAFVTAMKLCRTDDNGDKLSGFYCIVTYARTALPALLDLAQKRVAVGNAIECALSHSRDAVFDCLRVIRDDVSALIEFCKLLKNNTALNSAFVQACCHDHILAYETIDSLPQKPSSMLSSIVYQAKEAQQRRDAIGRQGLFASTAASAAAASASLPGVGSHP